MNPQTLGVTSSHLRLIPFLTLLVLFGAISTLPAANLPIVIAQGTSSTNTQQRNIPVSVPGNAGTIDRLWLRLHNVSYNNQVEVKAGSSGWIKLANNKSNVIIEAKGKDYGGIGGGFRTLTIEVDIPNGAVSAGSNTTVSFRLATLANSGSAANGSPSIDISAYRVIDFDFRNTAGSLVLPSNAHTMVGPNNYAGILNTTAAKNAGRDLWKQQNKLRAYPGGPPIAGSCASCHTRDGRDLKYFGFTNHSIIQRGRFHGLSETEAKEVASYIRSRPGGTPGRPWNPPYQPGPNSANDSVANWAAGEGLGAVRASDIGSLDAMFPDTNNNGKRDQSEIDSRFNTENGFGTGNRLETFRVPISVQLPDWNRWIPLMAPEDIWSDFRTVSDSPYLTYQNIRNELNSNGVSYYLANNSRKATLYSLLNTLGRDARSFIGKKRSNPADTRYDPNNKTTGSSWRIKNGPRVTGHGSTIGGSAVYQREMAKRVIAAWLAVKYFEIMKEYNLEDKSDEIFNNNPQIGSGKARGERRGWPIAQQNVHANAPHITSATLNNWEGQSTLDGDYLSSVWYHLQMVINAGQRLTVDTVSPQDWEYQLNHIFQLSQESGRHEPLRFMQSMMKIYQVRDNKKVNKGWMLRMTHPWRAISMERGGGTEVIETLNQYDPGLYTRIASAMIKEYVDVVRDNEFEGEPLGNSWARYDPLTTTAGAGSTNWWKLEIENIPLSAYTGGNWWTRNNAQSFYNLFPRLKYLGVKQDRINALKSWCEDAWPGTDWDETTAPNAGTYYKVQSVAFNSRSLRGESNLGSRAILDQDGLNGARVLWTPVAVDGGEWFRLRRQNYQNESGVSQYWLRTMNSTVGASDLFRVEMGSQVNTGDQTQWRFLPIGSGQYRVEGRAFGLQWLRAAGNDIQHSDADLYIGDQTKWKFTR